MRHFFSLFSLVFFRVFLVCLVGFLKPIKKILGLKH